MYQVGTDGLPNWDSRGLIQILWDSKTTKFPTSLFQSSKNMQHKWGVRVKKLNAQVLSRMCQNKNKLFLISEGRKVGLILQALL